MADITMCSGTVWTDNGIVACARKDNCYRHTATENPFRQSWFVVAPLIVEGDKQFCNEFVFNEQLGA